MKLSFVQPSAELEPCIESFWVFESPIGMPLADRSMAAPNGCAKLIIPYENSLTSVADGRVQVSREQGLYFVGNRDTSTLIHSSSVKTGFIAIEFKSFGAYPIFGIPMHETTNRLLDSDEVFPRWGREVREALRNREGAARKVGFIQDELIKLLRKNNRWNGLVEFCVQSLKDSHGRMPIGALERKTGYTRRYLDLLFREHVGLSPKILGGIFRFQKFYAKWASGQSFDLLKEDLHEHYFDQAHFTKEFRKMTGYSPRRFTLEVPNEFGRRLTLK
jgi:AraC-like DNA-binding protein